MVGGVKMVDAGNDARASTQSAQPVCLLIDDDAPLRSYYTVALSRRGMMVLAADNGAEGLSLVDEHEPQVIVLDLKLPGIDGYEVLNLLRNGGEQPEAIVIILTASHQFGALEWARANGAVDYLLKPVTGERLGDLIMKYLAEREAAAAA